MNSNLFQYLMKKYNYNTMISRDNVKKELLLNKLPQSFGMGRNIHISKIVNFLEKEIEDAKVFTVGYD